MRFMVEGDFLKLASSIVASSLLDFVERDERGGRGDLSGCRGEAGCGRDCESGEQKGLFVRIACVRAGCQSSRGGTAGASLRESQDVVGSTSIREGARAIQRSEPLHRWIEPE